MHSSFMIQYYGVLDKEHGRARNKYQRRRIEMTKRVGWTHAFYIKFTYNDIHRTKIGGKNVGLGYIVF